MRDGGLLCLIGSHGSGKTTLISALATVLANPDWTPDPAEDTHVTASKFSSFASKRVTATTVPETLRRKVRVYVHLTMGATTSSTRHSGLLLTALPQMTQLRTLLATWIERIFTELRAAVGDVAQEGVGQRLTALETEMASGGIIDISRDGDLGYVIVKRSICQGGMQGALALPSQQRE